MKSRKAKTGESRPSRVKSTQSARGKLAGIPKPGRVPSSIRKPTGKNARKWNADALFNHVMAELCAGKILLEVCRKIGVSSGRIWQIANSTPERASQYALARKEQAKSIADQSALISDGRDALTQKRRKKMERLARRIAKKHPAEARYLMESFEKTIVQRNRLQLDARKWFTRTLDPTTYGERTDIGLGRSSQPDDSGAIIRIEFVAPEDSDT